MKPILILIMLLVVTSCTTDTRPTVSTPTADTTTEQVDLTDPVTQTSLGSPPFSPVNWQRFVGPFDIVGDDALPNVDQMALIDAALAELPIEVFQHPRSFVRTSAVPANLDPTRTLAVAAGPDIYLLDNVFAIDGSTSLLNLTYAVAHELAHTDQWFHLTDEYVQTVLSGDVDRVDLLEGSSLVRSFASATGWAQDTDGSWTLSDEHRTASVYARTNPAEDMAESVAWASVGRSDWLDQPRRDWVEQWAGMPLDQFAADMPWSPAGSDELTAATPIYDEDAVSQFANDRSASAHRAGLLRPTAD